MPVSHDVRGGLAFFAAVLSSAAFPRPFVGLAAFAVLSAFEPARFSAWTIAVPASVGAILARLFAACSATHPSLNAAEPDNKNF